MKRKILFLLALSILPLSACNNAYISPFRNKITVTLLNDPHVRFIDRIKYIDQGSDVSFTLTVSEGYFLSGCDYLDYEINELDNGKYEIKFHKVDENKKINLEVYERGGIINYYPNGGTIKDGSSFYKVNASFKNHKRINTINGIGLFSRDGYQLIGWNYEEDGSGESVGLCSRVSLDDDKNINLYAMWKKESDVSSFSFIEENDEISITSYLGNENEIVIPQKINDKEVTTIKENAFNNNHASSIYLPYTVDTIEDNAFINSDLSYLSIFDSIIKVSDASFSNCNNFATLHINAFYEPCYVTSSRHSFYADKIDYLIESQEVEKSRLLFVGESGVWFNIHGKVFNNFYGDKYRVLNLGLNGFYSGVAQLEIIKHFLRENDQFVHIITASSYYQTLMNTDMTSTMWTCLELNYDLFDYVDIRKATHVFNSFFEYMSTKLSLIPEEYSLAPSRNHIDEYGSIPFDMPQVNGDERLLDYIAIDKTPFDEENCYRLKAYYDEVKELTNRTVLYGFGAINYDGLSEEEREETVINDYCNHVYNALEGHVIFFDHLGDNIFRGHNFYYTNFHLISEKGIEYSTGVANKIRNYL